MVAFHCRRFELICMHVLLAWSILYNSGCVPLVRRFTQVLTRALLKRMVVYIIIALHWVGIKPELNEVVVSSRDIASSS